MNAPLTAVAAALVRTWTWIYTRGTPVFVREGRRQEIESDLWEQQHDPAGGSDGRIAAQIVGRLLAGLADDLQWRFELGGMSPLRTRMAVAAVVGVAVLGGAWIYSTAQLLNEQPPPIAPLMSFVAAPPPPQPPPPPPPPPPPAHPRGIPDQ